MDQEALELLEYPGFLEIIAGMTQSPAGRARVLSLLPSADWDEIQHRCRRVREAVRLAEQGKSVSLRLEGDPQALFEELRWEGRTLDREDFLLLLSYLRAGHAIISLLRSSDCEFLKSSWLELPPLSHLLQALTRTFDDDGEIRDEAHPELAQTRQRGRRARKQVQEHLEKLLEKHQKSLIPGAYVTQRNHRYVIPARVEHQRSVAGVVHAASSSGATVFVEPFSAVELNNECLYCDDLEQEIIAQVLAQLSRLFRNDLPALRRLVDLLAEFDSLQSIARYADRHRCTLAELSTREELRVREARHPLLLESLGSEGVIPLDLVLPEACKVLIISGPNTGGKTVALKTIGLLALAAHSGLPVPAREAVFPFLRQVQADIGDHQSIAENLSTFSAHILRIGRILRDLQTPGLVLLDEIGSGTDPIYGGALGVAILDAFRQAGALLVATTHLRGIKAFASARADVVNASVGLDPSTLRPTFRLSLGGSGESSALEIAAQLGLPAALIAEARSHLSQQEKMQELYLEELRLEKKRLQEEQIRLQEQTAGVQKELASQRKEFEEHRKQLEKQFEKSIKKAEEGYQRDVGSFLKGVEDRMEAARLRQQAARRREALRERARETIRHPEPAEPGIVSDWSPGEEIYHRLFRKRGCIVELKGENAILEIDGKKVASPISQLTRIERKEVTREPSKRVVVHVVEDTNPELNLVGRRIDEALDLLDKFLDRAFLSELSEVRIIHGFGTGRLKNAVQEMLLQHPQVERSQVEGGATVVFLKN